MPLCGTVVDLKTAVSTHVNIPQVNLILTLSYDDGDHSSLRDDSKVDGIPEMDNCIFAIEVPGMEQVKSLLGVTSNSKSISPPAPQAKVDGLAVNFQNRMNLLSSVDQNDDTILVLVTNVEVKKGRFRR